MTDRQTDKNFHQFLQTQSMKNMIRVISCGGTTVGCWLDAIPSSQDYTLSYAEFCMSSL